MDRKLPIVDFICIGFPKCGTTTLYSVLGNHSEINLARGKETSFFNWCDDFAYPLEALNGFFRETRNKKHMLNGLIESEFYMNASDLRFYMGQDVKLIFMLRNPVDRLFSAFKMRLRQGCGSIIDLYRKNKELDTARMFAVYCDCVVTQRNNKLSEEFETGNYVKWLRQFEHEFSRENMLIVFLEDFKKDADKEIRRIENFLGIAEKDLWKKKIENEGNMVSKNYYCSMINGFFNKFYQRHNGFFVKYPDIGDWWIEMRNRMYGRTLKEDAAHIDNRTRQLCEQYYEKSKKELETYVNRELSSIWFD